jgi:NitT/TauT family transport system substrate-binding protein
MIKKAIIAILAVLAIAGVVGSYFVFTAKQEIKAPEKLVMGWNAWPGVLSYIVAYENGFFEDENLDIELKLEENYTSMSEDLTGGKIDFSPDMVLIDVMERNSNGADLAVVGLTDYSNGADGIAVGKEIKSVSGLKGKKIAVEQGALGDYFLFLILEQYGLNMEDVTRVNLTAQEGTNAFIKGEVDAVVTYEPNLSRAVRDGQGTIIFSSANVQGAIVDTLVFQKKFASEKPEVIKAVLRAYFRGIDFIKDNPGKSYETGAKYFKMSAEEFANQLKGLKLAGKIENLVAFSYSSGPKSIFDSFKNRELFLRKIGKWENNILAEDMILKNFITEVLKK